MAGYTVETLWREHGKLQEPLDQFIRALETIGLDDESISLHLLGIALGRAIRAHDGDLEAALEFVRTEAETLVARCATQGTRAC